MWLLFRNTGSASSGTSAPVPPPPPLPKTQFGQHMRFCTLLLAMKAILFYVLCLPAICLRQDGKGVAKGIEPDAPKHLGLHAESRIIACPCSLLGLLEFLLVMAHGFSCCSAFLWLRSSGKGYPMSAPMTPVHFGPIVLSINFDCFVFGCMCQLLCSSYCTFLTKAWWHNSCKAAPSGSDDSNVFLARN